MQPSYGSIGMGGRMAIAVAAPFVPFVIGFAGKWATPESGAFDPLVLAGYLAVPALAGLMIRLVGAWSPYRWTIALVAVAAGVIFAAGFWETVHQECLEVPKALWLAVPGALVAGWAAAIEVITAVIARPTGSRIRAVAAFAIGFILAIPLLMSALLLWNLLPDLPTIPYCEVMHIL